MKIIKKYTAIMVGCHNTNDEIVIELSYGRVEGPYYDKEYPKESFDSEDEAIIYAYVKWPTATWLIVPIVKFERE